MHRMPLFFIIVILCTYIVLFYISHTLPNLNNELQLINGFSSSTNFSTGIILGKYQRPCSLEPQEVGGRPLKSDGRPSEAHLQRRVSRWAVLQSSVNHRRRQHLRPLERDQTISHPDSHWSLPAINTHDGLVNEVKPQP